MLEIKRARPKETYKAVYVTKDNADEFLKLAYGHFGEPTSIERHRDGVIYRYDRVSLVLYYNCWYTENTDPDTLGWECQEGFDEWYEIVGDYTMNDKCKDCIYFHMYKKLRKGEWEYSSCCTYSAENPDDSVPSYDDWVLEVDEDDLCEMFKKRKR